MGRFTCVQNIEAIVEPVFVSVGLLYSMDHYAPGVEGIELEKLIGICVNQVQQSHNTVCATTLSTL